MVRLVQLLVTTERAVAIVPNWIQSRITLIECQSHPNAHMTKTSALSVRVTDDVKAAVEKAAAEDSRSAASYVERLLIAQLKKDGYLPKQ